MDNKVEEINRMFEGYFERLVFLVLGSLWVIFGFQLFVYWLIDKYTKYNIPLLGRVILSIAGTIIIYGLTLTIIGE